MSRAFLGIAAGNEMAEDYMGAVVDDLGALLDWKSNRVRPAPRAAVTAPRAKQGNQ